MQTLIERMAKAYPFPTQALTKASIILSVLALASFVGGLLTGGTATHQQGEEWPDMLAFILCRMLSPALAASGWVIGFAVVLMRPSKPVGSILAMLALLILLLALFCYSAWLGFAAFHPNSLTQ